MMTIKQNFPCFLLGILFIFQKGIIDSAKEKASDVAESVKDTAQSAYDKVTGRRAEDKAADKVKENADYLADKVMLIFIY